VGERCTTPSGGFQCEWAVCEEAISRIDGGGVGCELCWDCVGALILLDTSPVRAYQYSSGAKTNVPPKPHSKGAFNFSQVTLPPLLAASTNADAHPPTLIFTGATASVKGSALFAAFATMKFALHAMAQSLAREMGPRGVHVAHVVVDGVIDTPGTKGWDMGEGGKIDPVAVSASSFCYFRYGQLGCGRGTSED